MFFRPQPVHFIGIGGIGMSSLAEVLMEMGYPVTGSDQKFSPTTERLRARGAVVYEGHAAANLAEASTPKAFTEPSESLEMNENVLGPNLYRK